MRYRCPKDGRYVSEMTCMYCTESPKGWEKVDSKDPYEICRKLNEGSG